MEIVVVYIGNMIYQYRYPVYFTYSGKFLTAEMATSVFVVENDSFALTRLTVADS